MRYLVTYKARTNKHMIDMTALQTDDYAEAKECAEDAAASQCPGVELFDRETMKAEKFLAVKHPKGGVA